MAAKRKNETHEEYLARCRQKYKEEHIIAQQKRYRDQVKAETIAAYGGACQCCGENIAELLTIDHVNNDGFKDKVSRESRTRLLGVGFYRRLKKAGWPKDNFQLLCYNCNCAKARDGVCPHEKIVRKMMEVA